MRQRKLMLNTVASVLQQIITIMCGLILPRFFLKYYGSDVNGLVSSVSQFLGFISFMQLGVGAVVQSAWYKPLAERNNDEISRIYVSADKFFKKIAVIFIAYTTVLCFLMPYIISEHFDGVFVATIVVSIAISLFIQYFFGLTNQLLLTADQRAYVNLFSQSAIVIGNTVCSLTLMWLGFEVQVVKLVSSLLFAINPLIMVLYVKRHYTINRRIRIDKEPIQQKWNGFAQHLSSVIMDNTDVIILTLFSSLSNVSIYYVYHLVVYGIRQLITTLTVGIQSLLGNLLALNDIERFNNTFDSTEFLFHLGITFLYSCVMMLVRPFIQVYTLGVIDANYDVPLLAMIMSIAFAVYCYRLPYYAVIKAAGHYKETQKSAIIEMLLNLTISVLFVIRFGLVGVAIGTLIAASYRTVFFVCYLSKNIINRPVSKFVKSILIDTIVFVLTYIFTKNMHMGNTTYISWFVLAVKNAFVCGLISVLVYRIGYCTKRFTQ